jgi:two-component system sporulation sensor kinase B
MVKIILKRGYIMISVIKPLFVNIALIFSLTFIANMILPFYVNRPLPIKNKVFFGLIGAIGALLCMIYPIESLGATVFDLRTIPLIVVTLYAGSVPGAITAGAIIIGRLSIGGEYAWIGVLLTVVAFIIAFSFSQLFATSHKKWKPGLAVGFIYFLFYILIVSVFVEVLPAYFYYVYFISFYITYFAIFYLIEHLISINMQLEETIYLDKLSVLGQMTAAIAHEVRNPMTTVRGLIQLIAKDSKDEKLQQFSPLILDELDRTNKIITDYLSLMKPSNAELKCINLSELLNDTIDLMKPLASYSNVTLKLDLKNDYYIMGDSQQLKQCLINIIKNGIEACDGEDRFIEITAYKGVDKKTVEISIRDNGKGMTTEELERLGLPFYTTKSEGTGLGTMITNQLVRRMGGNIHYKSEIDKGTETTVEILSAEEY